MIELEVQFQIVAMSVLFGMIFANLYSLIDIVFKKSKVFRFIIELCFFLIGAILLYYLLFIINKGIFNVYVIVSLILGVYIHKKFYDKHFSCLYNYWFLKINSIIEKRKDRWKKLWKGLVNKKTKKAKLIE